MEGEKEQICQVNTFFIHPHFAINLVFVQKNDFKKMKWRKILQDSLGH